MPSTAADADGNSPVLHVVAGVLRRDGHILLARRHTHAHQGGLWEYPGGKVDAGETLAAALVRELHEELGVDVISQRPLITIPWNYPDRRVVLHVFLVTEFSGEPHGREGQPVAWVEHSALDDYHMPAANRAISRALQLPSCYLITPEPVGTRRDWLDALRHYVGAGGTLVQLRAKTLDTEAMAVLARQVTDLLSGYPATRLLINSHEALAIRFGTGLHLTSEQLRNCRVRPDVPGLVAASCHDLTDIRHANALDLDFIVLSPVQAAKHPGQPLLGWTGFAELAAEAAMPVYALGGVGRLDIEAAVAAGGQGVAAIRGLWPGRASG